MVMWLHALPGGEEEVNRLIVETGAKNKLAPLGKLRAFKIRLEGAMVRMNMANSQRE